MKPFFEGFLDLLYPPLEICPLCGLEFEGDYCSKCTEEIKKLSGLACKVCGKIFSTGVEQREDEYSCTDGEHICALCSYDPPAFDFAKAVGVYDGLLKQGIYYFKYTGKQSLTDLLSGLMVETMVKDDRFRNVEIIVPVPLHPLKLKLRAFNQAELLAQKIGDELLLPVVANGLIRIKHTMTQSKLTAEERIINLKGSFAVTDENAFYGKQVLLVDDILTTGTTVNECTKTLKQAGATNISVLALATGKITL